MAQHGNGNGIYIPYTALSLDDLKFINIAQDSPVTQCEDGHYQVRLPLRNPRLSMPANKCQAERRALGLKRKCIKNAKFHEDYVAFLENVIKKVSPKRSLPLF